MTFLLGRDASVNVPLFVASGVIGTEDAVVVDRKREKNVDKLGGSNAEVVGVCSMCEFHNRDVFFI
jgi:hypothetical protein